MHHSRFLFLAILLALLPSSTSADVTIALTFGGESFTLNGFTISGGHGYAKTGTPGVLFGTVQSAGGKPKFTYFVIFKGIASDQTKLARPETDIDVKGSVAIDHTRLLWGKTVLDLRYEMSSDAATGKVPSESLTVNGKPIELAKGRVLFADVSGKEVTWSQVDAPLPTDELELRKQKTSPEILGKKILEGLARNHRSVSEFLK